jgi:hypothetical protein
MGAIKIRDIQKSCRVISMGEETALLKSLDDLQGEIPLSLIRDNHIELTDKPFTLPAALFDRWILNPAFIAAQDMLEQWFHRQAALLFSKRRELLGNELTYCIRPKLLKSGGAYIGGFSYSLGELFESMENGGHYFLDEFHGYKALFLISVSGSPLSGSHSSIFWSDHSKEFVRFTPSQSLRDGFMAAFTAMKKIRNREEEEYLISAIDLDELITGVKNEN